uniref:Uncharacterized protein n=1 Tax=virus sp. ct1Uu26 TaxID=2826789 RepID=A0A8S5R816_9VIRU|nr:MAG TPA: hypothetical protein [virus sp. ct1Uu26]
MVSKTERELSDSFYFFTDYIMKELRQNKAFRVLCWQIFNAGIAFLLSSLGGLE